ncbi:MAG: A/G-specific adenine glycosylase [Streptococcaceae bacterium]|jgi:A/G-specific adenine glycosylase|nr:A/G-specific adenine glycosylase [Streptococcaceae bacterium]
MQPDEKIEQLQKALLAWYDGHKKPLPWRAENFQQNPYAIWVSEVMSQQTQTGTVIPYWERWLVAFPTIEELALADESQVLKLWEGLGYYSRARNLQAGARAILADFEGQFPSGLTEIQKIPGIGPYTAAAIGSIAFGLAAPAVDGNLFRVGARLFALSDDISKAKTRAVFEAKFSEIISRTRPGDFNQALMDVGSQICTPKNPSCASCPLAKFCLANEEGTQEQFPVKSAKIKQKQLFYQAFILRDAQNAFLLEKRPSDGLLADMWTFPMTEVASADSPTKIPETLKEALVRADEIGDITHVFSHLKWHVKVFVCQLTNEPKVADSSGLYNQQWFLEAEFSKIALPKPQQKMFDIFQKSEYNESDNKS